jgi:HK97 family phage portal protein
VLRSLLQRLFVGYYPYTTLPIEPSNGGPMLVTAINAIRYTPIYRATSLIASDIARTRATISDPTVDALWRNPSTLMPGFEFKRSMVLQTLLFGNSFALINRTLGGDLIELIPLDAESVSIDNTGPRPFYRSAQYGDLALEQVLHFRAPGTTGLWGDSPVRLCNTAVSLMASQERMALNAYSNGGNPKLALVHPGPLSLEARQRIMADYEMRHSGSENAGRPVVLAEGMKVERISSTLDDTGLESARRFSVADVSRIYGIPTSYLSESTGSAYGTMEWLSRMYVDSCLSQWMETVRAEVLHKLLPFGEMTFDVDAIIRPGVAEQMAALRTGVEGGFLTRNEARARLDLAPLPGLDEPTLALNVGAGGGTTNLGSDTSAEAGSVDDFSS